MVGKIKLFVLMGVLCALVMAPAVSFAGKKAALKEFAGKSYYTAVNIWIEKADAILTTNFHKGQLLAINSPVKIVSVNKKGISFTDKNDISYTILIAKKHTPIPAEEVFTRYFSEAKVNLGQFNGNERKNIEAGTIAVGMSKAAVLAAYGYPPTHMTPSVENNQWKYWKDRFRTFLVIFNKDGKVERVGNE